MHIVWLQPLLLMLSPPSCVQVLRHAPVLVPFAERAKLFQQMVALERQVGYSPGRAEQDESCVILHCMRWWPVRHMTPTYCNLVHYMARWRA